MSNADQLISAALMGAAQRHAGWSELTREETAAAVAELRELAGGRADLLAETAGLLLGFHEGDLDEPKARAAADLCIKAGADEDLVRRWTEEGRRRAAAARYRYPAASPQNDRRAIVRYPARPGPAAAGDGDHGRLASGTVMTARNRHYVVRDAEPGPVRA